jgi:hypothetical protein
MSKDVTRLTRLAGEIRHDIEAADKHWQNAVKHAIRAGEGLIEAKSQLAHGQWLPWLRENFPGFSERSASNYMRMARNSNAVADLPTIRQAIAVLTSPRPGLAHESATTAADLPPIDKAHIEAGVELAQRSAEITRQWEALAQETGRPVDEVREETLRAGGWLADDETLWDHDHGPEPVRSDYDDEPLGMFDYLIHKLDWARHRQIRALQETVQRCAAMLAWPNLEPEDRSLITALMTQASTGIAYHEAERACQTADEDEFEAKWQAANRAQIAWEMAAEAVEVLR